MTSHETKYLPLTSGQAGGFGISVCMNDSYVVCGEPLKADSPGKATLFNLANTTSQALTPDDGSNNDSYGFTVQINISNNICIGAYQKNNYLGGIYNFNTSGTQLSKIDAPSDTFFNAPTQLLSSSFNLSGNNLNFYPNGFNGTKYTWIYNPINNLWTTSPPNSISGHTTASLSSDDESIQISLTNNFVFYGTEYSTIYINTNGNITFSSGDTDNTPTWSDHFSSKRISFAFADLSPFTSGTIYYGYKTTTATNDTFVITFVEVDDGTSTTSIQVLLSLKNDTDNNGIINIYYGTTSLTLNNTTCIVGLSNGSTPSDINSPGVTLSSLPELSSKNSISEINKNFGHSIAFNNNFTLVGSPGALDGKGCFYIYGHDIGESKYYAETTQYNGSIYCELKYYNGCSEFGWGIDYNSNLYIAVSALRSIYSGKGAIFLYKINNGSVDFIDILVPEDGSNSDFFGLSITMNDNFIAVGAPEHNTTGAVYIYSYDSDTEIWSYSTKLTSNLISSGDKFGFSVSIDSNNLLTVGSIETSTTGVVIMFKYISSTWTQVAQIIPSDTTSVDYFGALVFSTSNDILISSPYSSSLDGAVYRYSASSNCYHKNTMIMTDKGEIKITKLKRGDNIKTNNGYKKIARLLELLFTENEDMVVFEKDSIDKNIPNEKLIITKGHPIYYNGDYYNSEDFANNPRFENVSFQKINDNKLYHIQFETHEVVYTNNLTTTSLPPYTRYKGSYLPEEMYFDKSLFNKNNIGKNYKPYMLHDDPLLCNKLQ